MRRYSVVLPLVVLVFLAAACGGRARDDMSPTAAPPRPVPNRPVQVTTPTQVAAAPEAAAAPTVPAPDWLIHGAGIFTVSLPATWQVIDLDAASLDKWYAGFEQSNPPLAQIIGSKENLAGAELWAFDAETIEENFTDNLNIRRLPLQGEDPAALQAAIDAVIAQHKKSGLRNVAGQAGLSIGGRPAGRITYQMDLQIETGTSTVSGYQFLVAGPDDFWVLSYTIGPGRAARQAMIERSATSFRVK